MNFSNVVISVVVSAILTVPAYGCNYCSCDYVEEYCDDDYAVSEGGTCVYMAHWANLRDEYGNIIGQLGAGAKVKVIGICQNDPSRSVVYDYGTGAYGTVSSVYIYGGSLYEYENPTKYSYSNYRNTVYIDCSNCYQCSYYEQVTTNYNYEYSESYEYDCGVYCYDRNNLYIYDGYIPGGQDNIYSVEWNYVVYDSAMDICLEIEPWNEEDDDDSYFIFYGDEEILEDAD